MRLHSKRRTKELLAYAMALATLALFPAACSQTTTPLPPPPTTVAVQPAATQPPVSARLISHPLAGREACGLCHGEGEAQALPADHAGRDDDTCLACHDVQPAPARVAGGSAADQGEAIWQERPGLSCRGCHGAQAEGGFGPLLAPSDLDFATFRQRTRSPLSDRMPPIATGLDDPAFERGGSWISDEDLHLVYAWLAGVEPETVDEQAPPQGQVPLMPHDLEGREDCLLCHGPGGAMAVPENHTGWGNDMCLDCHTTEEEK